MLDGALGKEYEDGQCVIREGEGGNCMYVVQQGQLDVFVSKGEEQVHLSTLKAGDVFGEMSLFTRQPRSATVRARGKARVMTIDKKGFFKRVHEDPSLAFRVLQTMAQRIQTLDQQLFDARHVEAQ